MLVHIAAVWRGCKINWKYLQITKNSTHFSTTHISLYNRSFICGNIFVFIYIHEYTSRLLPQWPCGNSCSWAYDVELQIDRTNKPKYAQQAKQGA